MEDRVVDVWPDFLEREGAAINGKIRDPSLIGFGNRAFLARIVEISHARECSGSQNFAEIKGLVTLIGTRDYDPRECIAQPLGKVSPA